MDGESEEKIHEYFCRVEKICKNRGAIETFVPASERAKRKLLETREKFYHTLKRNAPMEVIDAVVPRSEIARFVQKVKELSHKHGIPVVVYGHAGDGNIHLHPVCRNLDTVAWKRKLPGLMIDIYRAGISFGGAISGEHGIGLAKKVYFHRETDPAVLKIMQEIKKAFDPNNILNPGKIFDL
jgi:glycolate oxidase